MDDRTLIAELRLLLNTRIGESPAAPQFGVPDLADLVHQFPAAGSAFQQAVRAAIASHAPHLRNLTVRTAPPSALTISALHNDTQIHIRVSLTPDGRCDLTPD